MARTRWPSDLGTPASSPGRADQTGSAGGCQKTWGPADKSSRKTARRRQPNRRSGRDPGPLTLRPRRLTVRGTGGQKHYPHSPCRLFVPLVLGRLRPCRVQIRHLCGIARQTPWGTLPQGRRVCNPNVVVIVSRPGSLAALLPARRSGHRRGARIAAAVKGGRAPSAAFAWDVSAAPRCRVSGLRMWKRPLAGGVARPARARSCDL
jgi:hypothetical protein